MAKITNREKFFFVFSACSILMIGIALDIHLDKHGQLFSSSGAVVIMSAIFVWSREKARYEEAYYKYLSDKSKLVEAEEIIDQTLQDSLYTTSKSLSDVLGRLDREPYDNESLRSLFFISLTSISSLASGLIKVNGDIKAAKKIDFALAEIQKNKEFNDKTYVKLETFLVSIGTLVWAFGAIAFETVIYYL